MFRGKWDGIGSQSLLQSTEETSAMIGGPSDSRLLRPGYSFVGSVTHALVAKRFADVYDGSDPFRRSHARGVVPSRVLASGISTGS